MISTPARTGLFLLLLATASCAVPGKPEAEPEAALLAWQSLLRSGEPQHVWRTLPDSYRQDLSDLIQGFGARMDGEVWDRGFVTLGKLALVLQDRRQFILTHPLVKMAVPPDVAGNLDTTLDTFAGALSVLAGSDIRTLDGLRGLDVDGFVEQTMPQVLSPFWKQLVASQTELRSEWLTRNLTIAAVDRVGDRATLHVVDPAGDAHSIDMLMVEESWVPERLAGEWDQMIAEGEGVISRVVITEQNRSDFLDIVSAADEALDTMLAAQDAVQFSKGLAQGLQLIGMVEQMAP